MTNIRIVFLVAKARGQRSNIGHAQIDVNFVKKVSYSSPKSKSAEVQTWWEGTYETTSACVTDDNIGRS